MPPSHLPSHLSGETEVWKFTIQANQTHMEMPAGARLLHVHEQRGQVCVWAEVDPLAPKVLRKVLAIPTGGRAVGVSYVGTAHLVYGGGNLVFHVYDGGEVSDG